MRMQKWFAGAPAGNGEGESDKFGSAKRAKNLPSGFRGNDEQGNRNHVNVRGFPHRSFDAHAGFEFSNSVAVANEYAIASFLGG